MERVANLLEAAEKLARPDQDLLDEKNAQPNALAAQLYRLLEQQGTEGVKARVREIFSRPGADMQNFRANSELATAVRHFREEADRDPSSKATAILKIIETNTAANI